MKQDSKQGRKQDSKRGRKEASKQDWLDGKLSDDKNPYDDDISYTIVEGILLPS